jgi:(E)-4-hydroxy-3-methylbut-2-enyl-diphosphate synthase
MADFPRRAARRIVIGGVAVGGGAPVVVQSMTKTDTRNVRATTAQVRRLERSGCEIVRLAVPDRRAAAALGLIKRRVRVPLVADVHFDHRLALASLDAGADGLRINPGNIGSREKVREVVRAAAGRAVPIRIGVNAGSLEKDLLARHGGATPEAMAESALRHVRILEDCGFGLIKISLKASDVPRTLAAYRLLAGRVDYPFHAGITEAGPLLAGSIKSAAGLALLLAEGLAAPPEREVYAAWRILESLGIRRRGVELVSCPACGRTEVDLRAVANRVELAVRDICTPMTVAVMGCTVNGPGEAKEADIGLACGRGNGVIFLKGRVLRKVRAGDMIDDFVEEIGKLARTSAGAGKEEG